MKSLETISNEITVLEAERDFGDITPEGLELLSVLNLCYDLLSRTKAAQAIRVKQPDEMKEPSFDDEETNVYGVSSSQLADFAFAIATKQGSVDLRKLLAETMSSHVRSELAKKVGIRPSTISEYMNHKSPFNCDSYQAIINQIIK
jgi:hypothetical protein